MTILWRTLLVTGTAFVLINAAASWLVWVCWPAVQPLVLRRGAATRARLTFAWRAAPSALSVLGSLTAGLAFLRFEPANPGERTGITLLMLAAIGVGALALGAARVVWTVRASERLARAWTAGPPSFTVPDSGVPAWVIDSDFPVVAVVGLRAPRMVVARCVVERCTPQELTVMLAHEHAHVAAHDNLKRLWLQCGVDGVAWTRRGAVIEGSWQEAAEDAADDRAALAGLRAVDLASALVRVARMAPGRRMPAWPVAACFYRGGGLERRVRRILHAPEPASPGRLAGLSGVPAVAAAAVVAGFSALVTPVGHAVYVAAEWLVQTLP
ncbi:MAG: M48 family metalloprotease [Vicinamibacterales bacterium]|nr:M48 family metalloprotease [Vicinamibacterales bacterium]